MFFFLSFFFGNPRRANGIGCISSLCRDSIRVSGSVNIVPETDKVRSSLNLHGFKTIQTHNEEVTAVTLPEESEPQSTGVDTVCTYAAADVICGAKSGKHVVQVGSGGDFAKGRPQLQTGQSKFAWNI